MGKKPKKSLSNFVRQLGSDEKLIKKEDSSKVKGGGKLKKKRSFWSGCGGFMPQ